MSDEPHWRRDFPIDWDEDDAVSRRDLVKFLVLTSGAFATGQAWLVAKSVREVAPGTPGSEPAEAAIAAVDELPIGGAKTFLYPDGSSPRLLVRLSEEAWVAYDQRCTHLLCPVVPAVDSGRIHCPCHNGWFDLLTGQPLAGPPRRALQRVLLEVRDGMVYAVGVARS